MQFFTLATAFAAAILCVQAYNPIGQPCRPQEQSGEGCASDASLNGGNAFIYECGPTNTFVYVAGCRCPDCCQATVNNGAFCI